MQKYRNVPIITTDDDQLVFKNFAEILYQSYLKHPNVIHSCRCHLIVKDWRKNILPYKRWKWDCRSIKEPSFDLFATGVGTVLYPPNILQISDNDIPMIKDILCQDDIFLKIKENVLGIKIKFVNGVILGKDLKEQLNAQKHALNINNTIKSGNDKIIKKYQKFLVK
jgi:hypothetical protein